MDLSDYTTHDAVALAELVHKKQVSPAELAEAANTAIDRVNPALNAVIGRLDPPVRDETADAGAAFFGVPLLLNDLDHGWTDVPCEMGSRLARERVEKRASHIGERLKASGLAAIGRTNTSELGISRTTEPELYGPTNNPWDAARSPGGSSGGAAAAVAAGIVPMAHASDNGGSLRVPAAWCGLIGFKPSRGRNPLGPGANDAAHSILAHHVLTRTVRDTAAALDVTSGPAGGDFVSLDRPQSGFAAALDRLERPLRIALCTRFIDAPAPEGPCVEAAVAAAKACQGLGHKVIEATPDIPYPEMSALCFELYTAMLVQRIEHISRQTGRSASSANLEPQTLAALKKGRVMTALDLMERFQRQAAMSHRMGTFMKDCDVLLTPGVSRVPCMTGEYKLMDYQKNDLRYWEREMECYTFSALSSITGQPSIVLPLYWTVSGLPVGVQFTATSGDDLTVLQLARQLEQAKPWSGRRPPVHAADS